LFWSLKESSLRVMVVICASRGVQRGTCSLMCAVCTSPKKTINHGTLSCEAERDVYLHSRSCKGCVPCAAVVEREIQHHDTPRNALRPHHDKCFPHILLYLLRISFWHGPHVSTKEHFCLRSRRDAPDIVFRPSNHRASGPATPKCGGWGWWPLFKDPLHSLKPK
jgi:hypothetical protein